MTNPVAFVLLDDARLPATEVLIAALRRRHPGLLWDSSAATAKMESNSTLIRAGDHLMVILSMPAPMPFDQRLWQQAS